MEAQQEEAEDHLRQEQEGMKEEDTAAAARGEFGFSYSGTSERYRFPIVMIGAVSDGFEFI